MDICTVSCITSSLSSLSIRISPHPFSSPLHAFHPSTFFLTSASSMSYDPPPSPLVVPAAAAESPVLGSKGPKHFTKSPKLASSNGANADISSSLKSPKLTSGASGPLGSPPLSSAISKRKSPKPSPLIAPKAPGASPRLPAASPRKKNPSPMRSLPSSTAASRFQQQPQSSMDFPQSDSGIEVGPLRCRLWLQLIVLRNF
jgi:hypothetical protein